MDATPTETGYVPINGLSMYYETYGAGQPLVLLHGGPTTINVSFGRMIPTLAQSYQVIAMEQQGHGHTADIDRPLSYEQMVEDTKAMLDFLHIDNAHVFGFSDGANVAMGLAIRYPATIRKLVLASGNYNYEGLVAEEFEEFANTNPDDLGPLKADYERVAPRPEDWPVIVGKVIELTRTFEGYRRDDLARIPVPTLIVIGDDDMIKPEHAIGMYRLIPHANLAVIPAADHSSYLREPSLLLTLVTTFFDAPMPDEAEPNE